MTSRRPDLFWGLLGATAPVLLALAFYLGYRLGPRLFASGFHG